MIRRLRNSFAAKLIAGGCILALLVVGGVAGYLIFSRASQASSAAQSTADNRAAVMSQVLDRFTGAQALSDASRVVRLQSVKDALTTADPTSSVRALLTDGTINDVAGEALIVSDASGRSLDVGQTTEIFDAATVVQEPQATRVALSGGNCTLADGTVNAGGCGVELLGGTKPAYVVSLPVVVAGVPKPVGAITYVAPLDYQLTKFQSLFGFPTAFIPAAQVAVERRGSALGQSEPTAANLRATLGQPAQTRSAIYEAPSAGGRHESVAGSFVAVRGPAHDVTGFIGIEVPLKQFTGDVGTDILVLSLIAVFAALLVTTTVVLFVGRFVKRPIDRLETGVARIAGGDYTTDIPVQSRDELGRLGGNVNRMRHAIAGYVRDIEEARERLDMALERVSGVSRALTTTTAGMPSLRDAVVDTAALIAGAGSSAILALRTGEELTAAATAGHPPPISQLTSVRAVLHGETVDTDHPHHGALVAVPMFYQEQVVGALIVLRGARRDEAPNIDVGVLAVLANNAAIAMENARLFEQERETVRRLMELDSLKSDFLATVQHELRTPLTAILGLTDLLDLYWGMWADGPKLNAVRDIQMAANNLHDIVETIIDYSQLDDENLGLNPVPVPVREAVEATVKLVEERYRDTLPVPIDVTGDPALTAFADAGRLSKVLRAVIENSLKFSEGRGRVGVVIASTGKRRKMVSITVTDRGIGIAPENLSHVFDRFFQVDSSATRRYGGTGMGLAMVKRVVEAHGAQVAVESILGDGTTVTLTWPAAPPPEAGTVTDPGRAPRRRGAVSEPPVPVQ